MKLLSSLIALCLLAMTHLQSLDIAAPIMPFIEGHAIIPTASADESTEWKYALLKGAESSIEMSSGFAHGQVFQHTLDILANQLQTNPTIKIHLMVSDYATLIKDHNLIYMEQLAMSYPDRFQYVRVMNSGPIRQEGYLYTTDNHMKLIIVDEKYFLLGGTNLADSNSQGGQGEGIPTEEATDFTERMLPKGAIDMDVVVSGPGACQLRKDFFTTFALFHSKASIYQDDGPFEPQTTAYFPVEEENKAVIAAFDENPRLIKDASVYTVISGPRFQLHRIGDFYEKLIDRAQISVQLAHMYFFPTVRIYNALIRASNRGLKTSLITNTLQLRMSLSNSSILLFAQLNRSNYLPFMMGRRYSAFDWTEALKDVPAACSIYEYNQEYILYHKKVMTTDHRYSVVGSYNLGSKSENADFEIAIFIDSPLVTKRIEEFLNKDKALSRCIKFHEAHNWHFNPFYTIPSWFQSTFLDGLVLDKISPAEMQLID